MKCKGCAHLRLLHYPEDDSPNYVHYCGKHAYWAEDTIQDARKVCQGRYYERQTTPTTESEMV